ncbi:MAG TPA: POTRA domain-containing protein, partial [Polyangia bacterium]|nr:POTRA domain-containing protein [Polyangia bacterium]
MKRGSIALAAIVFALAVSAPAVRAQTPATETAAPAVTSTPAPPAAPPVAPAPVPGPPAPAPGPATAPAARIPILGYELGGSRIDPDDQLRALMFSVAALGDPFVEAGPSDRIGRPFGTIPRLVQALDAVGYRAALSTRAAPGGVIITATLLPYERLRYVFVSGNRRIQQDEIQRRITIRPGQTLPPAGPERVAVLERERELIIDFLRSRGYFEANVGLEARSGSAPGSLDLYVSVRLGPDYPLGPITFTGNHAIGTEELDPMFRHGDWITLWNTQVPFTQKQLREDLEALTKRYRALGYAGVRVSTDFSVQKSIDRGAKNVRIAVTVNERKRIAVAFEGNASLSSSSLQDELTLFSRGSYDDYEVGASADAIQRRYQQEGHFFARVDWRRERLSADQERIVFSIDEGPELMVNRIEFVGAQTLSPQELAEVVTVRLYPFWGIGSGGY